MVHEDSPDKFSVRETVHIGGPSRTCAVDEETHKVNLFYSEGTTRENRQLVVAVLAPYRRRGSRDRPHGRGSCVGRIPTAVEQFAD